MNNPSFVLHLSSFSMNWLGRLDSNQDPQLQRLVCCPCTTPQCVAHCITATDDGQLLHRAPGSTVCYFFLEGSSFSEPVNLMGIVFPGVKPSLRASSKEMTSGLVGMLLVFSTASFQNASISFTVDPCLA